MIGLSKSALDVFQECARCFWLAKNAKLNQPKKPFPSILNAIDGVMKNLVERYLESGIKIPYLSDTELVPYPDRAKVEKFRSWQSFQRLVSVDGVAIKAWGEIDDLLVNSASGVVTPWDFKSKGAPPEAGYCEKYNQLQADLYHLLLEGQNLKCSGVARFTYVWPVLNPIGEITLAFQNVTMPTDPKNAMDILAAATKCLAGKMPPAGNGCLFCGYVERRKELKA